MDHHVCLSSNTRCPVSSDQSSESHHGHDSFTRPVRALDNGQWQSAYWPLIRLSPNPPIHFLCHQGNLKQTTDTSSLPYPPPLPFPPLVPSPQIPTLDDELFRNEVLIIIQKEISILDFELSRYEALSGCQYKPSMMNLSETRYYPELNTNPRWGNLSRTRRYPELRINPRLSEVRHHLKLNTNSWQWTYPKRDINQSWIIILNYSELNTSYRWWTIQWDITQS